MGSQYVVVDAPASVFQKLGTPQGFTVVVQFRRDGNGRTTATEYEERGWVVQYSTSQQHYNGSRVTCKLHAVWYMFDSFE